jgi:heterodisulfide reductase subunit C
MSNPIDAGAQSDPRVGSAATSEPSRARAGSTLDGCISCDACRAGCSMQRSTGRLHPSRLVRLAALGHGERVLRSREIWYCLECLRCTSACPVAVAPGTHIRAWRAEAVRHGYVDLGTLERYEALHRQLQRARARLLAECVLGPRDLGEVAAGWETLDSPADAAPAPPVRLGVAASEGALCDELAFGHALPATLSACLSCRECMTTCPVADAGGVYDPVRIFRMVRLGLAEELLASPTIWLCLGCEQCTRACTQGVSGHRVLARLQELAIARGAVPADVRARILAMDRALYPRFLDAVDRLWSACWVAK